MFVVDRSDTRLIPCPLRTAAARSPGAAAIVGEGGGVTYAELDRRVSAAAKRLAERGCGAGSRVALCMEKSREYIVVLVALIRIGAVACPLSTRFPPRRAVSLLTTAGCRAVISDDEDLLGATEPAILALSPEALLENDPPGEPENHGTINLDQPATIVFTSGSSGKPKAALHTFANHYYNALGSNENIPLAPGDLWLHSLPLYHVGGLSILFRCILAGATIALPEPGERIGEAISRYGITHASLVATQLRRVLDEGASPENLKVVLLGGSGMPASLLEEAVSRGFPVRASYGLTEMASQVTTTSGSSPTELRTSGRILPHRELSIASDGEILVRGQTLFAGYVENGVVASPVDSEGWFHTKDVGSLDEEGCLIVRGRKDNLFISGGENIQPEEIEAALTTIEGVVEAVVVPVPDGEWGRRPVAFVRMAAGEEMEPDRLRKSLEPLLPRFEIPAAFHEWPEDSGSESMKVDREAFRERARRMSREPL